MMSCCCAEASAGTVMLIKEDTGGTGPQSSSPALHFPSRFPTTWWGVASWKFHLSTRHSPKPPVHTGSARHSLTLPHLRLGVNMCIAVYVLSAFCSLSVSLSSLILEILMSTAFTFPQYRMCSWLMSQSLLWPKFQTLLVLCATDVGGFEMWQASTTRQRQERAWLDNDPTHQKRTTAHKASHHCSQIVFLYNIDFQKHWPGSVLPELFLKIIYHHPLCLFDFIQPLMWPDLSHPISLIGGIIPHLSNTALFHPWGHIDVNPHLGITTREATLQNINVKSSMQCSPVFYV